MFFDNDGFEEITPSFEQEASDNNVSDNNVVETVEPQTNAGNEQALHNKKFAQRRIDDRNRRLAEQARERQIQALQAKIDALEAKVASPKEEDSTDFLEKLAESPEAVLNEFLEKKLAQPADPELTQHYIDSRFIEPMYEHEALKQHVGIFEALQEIAEKDSVVAPIVQQLETFYSATEQAFADRFNELTKNGKHITPLVEAQLQKELKELIAYSAEQQTQFYSNPSNASIMQYIQEKYVQPTEASKTELPKNTRQLREDAIAPSDAPFKRINTFYR